MGVNECPEAAIRMSALCAHQLRDLEFRSEALHLKQHPRSTGGSGLGQRSAPAFNDGWREGAAFDEYLRKQMPEWYERRGRPDHVNWDYESEVTKSYISCFCPLCLERFRAFAGLDSVPERSEIPSRYMAEWTRFMNMRMAELAGKLRSALKACNENVRFSVYSGYQSETHKRVYGVDWSLLADKIDVAMAGYGRPIDELNATRTALGKTPLVLAYSLSIRCETKNRSDLSFGRDSAAPGR